MKSVKHFYYPYCYIEHFNGGIITIFFLDKNFHYEDESDLFISRINFFNKKKSKKVIESKNQIELKNNINNFNDKSFKKNFFNEFFY